MPGSGDPQLSLSWEQAQGDHVVGIDLQDSTADQFLSMHSPSLTIRPTWESSEWAEGANAFGHVDVEASASFRWATPGEWIVESASLSDKAQRNSGGYFYYLGDESKDIYPSLSYDLYWDDQLQSFVESSGEYNLSREGFQEIHGLDLSTLEFDLINTSPDITPPKFENLAIPDSLNDGILDIGAGEDLLYTGTVTDFAETQVVSGYSGASINLQRIYGYEKMAFVTIILRRNGNLTTFIFG